MKNPGFNISILVDKKLIYEIFLRLTIQKNVKRERSNKTMRFRALIQRHRHNFLSAARLEPINFTYAQQPAAYESTRMHTAYINNTKVHLGKLLRRIINEPLGVKNSAKTLREQLINQGLDTQQIRKNLEELVYGPARQFKLSLFDQDGQAQQINENAYRSLLPFLRSYAGKYTFKKIQFITMWLALLENTLKLLSS